MFRALAYCNQRYINTTKTVLQRLKALDPVELDEEAADVLPMKMQIQ